MFHLLDSQKKQNKTKHYWSLTGSKIIFCWKSTNLLNQERSPVSFSWVAAAVRRSFLQVNNKKSKMIHQQTAQSKQRLPINTWTIWVPLRPRLTEQTAAHCLKLFRKPLSHLGSNLSPTCLFHYLLWAAHWVCSFLSVQVGLLTICVFSHRKPKRIKKIEKKSNYEMKIMAIYGWIHLH